MGKSVFAFLPIWVLTLFNSWANTQKSICAFTHLGIYTLLFDEKLGQLADFEPTQILKTSPPPFPS